MGDWSGAKWLRLGDIIFNDKNYKNTSVDQTIELTINTVSGNPGITFDTEAEKSCFWWQFFLDENSVTLQRKMRNWGSDLVVLGDVKLSQFKKSDFIGKDVKIKLEIFSSERKVFTYINGVKVDELKVTGKSLYPERIGFCDRSGSGDHEIYFDDIKHHYSYVDGVKEEYMSEDFSNGISHHFLDLDIVKVGNDYKGHIKAGAEGYFVSEMKSHRPIYYTDFRIDKPIQSVKLFTSAIGNYDAYINGDRVGTMLPDGTTIYEELKPSFTDFRHRVCYFSHDITHLCKSGDNIVGIELNEGYSGGDISHSVHKNLRSVIAKLLIRYTDGSEKIIVTDESWKLSRIGPLMDGDIYRGEYFDARYKYPWEEGYDYKPFSIRVYSVDSELVPFSGQPLVSLSTLAPKGIIVYDEIEEQNDFGKIKVKKSWNGQQSFVLKKGETAIFDFGQNCAGVPNFKVKGNRSARMTLKFAERLNDSGALSRNNDGPEGSIYRKNYRYDNVGVLYYTLAGKAGGESHRPTSTYFGYRYCEMTASEDIEVLSMETVPLSSSYEKIGSIATDNNSVNKIFENTLWGQYSNFINIPTDCPSRNEKMGWTGDINIFAQTALYNANVTEFLRKWLRDLRDGQMSNGAYLDIAPYMIDNNCYGNTAWADAGILIPWTLYMMSGNVEIIRENYESMRRYMDYTASFTKGNIKHPGTGNQYGDWWGFGTIDKLFMSEAFYARTTEVMSKMAAALSVSEGDSYDIDSKKYKELHSKIIDEMQSLYFNSNGLISPTQSACALAISFGICEDRNQMNAVGKQLSDLVAQNGHRLTTGFVCTPFLLKALSDTGHDDVAYTLLLQKECPSWNYMIDQGATTFWELWNGYTKETGFHTSRENSFNHFAYGAVVEWMYSHMAGIRYDEEVPGFKKIIFKPHPDTRTKTLFSQPNVRNAKSVFESPYGQIFAEWRMEDGELSYEISVPANTEAKVLLPMNGNVIVNEKPIKSAEGVSYIGEEDGRLLVEVRSGKYIFKEDKSNSMHDRTLPSARVYPNPVVDVLHIQVDCGVRSSSLFDVSGRLVMVWGENETDLDVSSIRSAGVYILRIETDKGVLIKKIIKK
ncbi:MAG: family 78 glycoside hydrolase catalytic domain [Clostridium sp.]|nr:family 78 glycoside hydrolase catalytic domain [Clostridium sp.]